MVVKAIVAIMLWRDTGVINIKGKLKEIPPMRSRHLQTTGQRKHNMCPSHTHTRYARNGATQRSSIESERGNRGNLVQVPTFQTVTTNETDKGAKAEKPNMWRRRRVCNSLIQEERHLRCRTPRHQSNPANPMQCNQSSAKDYGIRAMR